ncbi:MAG: hypothetical protein NTW32_21200 [Chloroflexi bacterium]|nr:hypothetical protein [Chloroflexota bacterium]
MAKFKPCNYDQMVMLPISLENQLIPGSLEQTINELVEKHIELSVFDERYSNDDTGASAIHPKVLLKIVLFAYSKGLCDFLEQIDLVTVAEKCRRRYQVKVRIAHQAGGHRVLETVVNFRPNCGFR